MTSLKRALRRVPGLRQAVQPARRMVHRARVWRTGPGALVATPGTPVGDLRWAARTARARGNGELADAALLLLVARGGASEQEQRLVRAGSGGRPLPAAPIGGRAASTGDAVSGDVVLTLRRDPVGRGVQASIDDPSGPTGPGHTVTVWQPAWAQLPAALAEQLTVCALTRAARQRAVTEIHAADPGDLALATAIGEVIGARLRSTTSRESG